MDKKKIGQVVSIWIAVILCLLVMGQLAHAETSKRTIKVGCFPLNGFYDIDDKTGEISGYGADYTEEVFDHLNWNCQYVKYPSWVEALDALSKNEIDLLAPAQHTSERDATYGFDSFPISTEYGALLTLDTNDKLVYEDYQAYNGLNVGVVSSLIFLDKFKDYEARNNFQVNLSYYKDTAALVSALNAGEVDAILVNMMVKTDSMKLLARFGASPVYYMVSPGAGDILEELNLAIDTLSSEHPELQNELSSTYFSDFNKLPYSKEELNYIKKSGILTVACKSNHAPFSYVDDKTGEIDGADKAIMEKIANISGLTFSYTAIPEDEDAEMYMKDQRVALAAGVENDAKTQLHDSNLTESYFKISRYFIGQKNKTFDSSQEAVVSVINMQEDQLLTLKKAYPKFTFEEYNSVDDYIKAVRSDKATYFFSDRYSTDALMSSPKNDDLTLFPTEAIPSNLCVQVLLDDGNREILTSILNKSINQLSDQEKEELLNEYVQKNRYQYTLSDFFYQYRIQIISACIILLASGIALSILLNTKKKARQEIEEKEMKLRNITNNINGGVIVLKEKEGLRITFANDGFLDLIGCTRKEFDEEGHGSYLAYVHPDDTQILQDTIDSDKDEMSLELRVLKKDGSYIPALFNCTSAERSNGTVELYCVILDMTEQNKLLEALRIEKRRSDLILDRVEEIFYEINLQEHTIITSTSFSQRMGWTLPSTIPADKSEYGAIWHTDAENLEKMRVSTEEMYKTKQPVSTIALLQSTLENRMIWCEVFQYPILSEDNTIITIIGLIRDVDEQVSEREKLLEQAQRDPLTGLYNKETFEEIVRDTLKRLSNQNHALIFIDLDHFKSVNDTLGHLTGDQAICDAADKLKVIFSNFDVLSRFGGDEFCIFVKNIPMETLKGKMDWLVDKMHHDYIGEKGTVHITCSCGIACTHDVGYDYDKLMQCADECLYASKEQGRDQFTFFKA